MASDLDFSPPEVPEPTFLENLLRYGLFLGAIFQLICVLAIIIPVPKSHEAVSLSLWASAPRAGFWVLKITGFTAVKTSRGYAGLDWFKVSPHSHLVALGHVVHTLFVCICVKQIFILYLLTMCQTLLKDVGSALKELLVFGRRQIWNRYTCFPVKYRVLRRCVTGGGPELTLLPQGEGIAHVRNRGMKEWAHPWMQVPVARAQRGRDERYSQKSGGGGPGVLKKRVM